MPNNANSATKTKQEVEGFDFSIADGTAQEYLDVFPRIQWHHGSKQMQKVGGMSFTGGLFIPSDQYPNFAADGWQDDSFITKTKNEEISGFYSSKANLAIIRVKTFWDDNGSHTHAICCVKGMDAVFCLQVGGLSKGAAFNRAFTAHRNQIVAAVNRTKPDGANSYEPFALWMVVTPEPHDIEKGKNGGESPVTRPTLFTPEAIDMPYLRTLWVGAENYKRFIEIWKETEQWQTQIPKQSEAQAEYTGNGGGVTDEQLKRLLDLSSVKGFDEAETMQGISGGKRTKFDELTKDEATDVIERLAAR